MHTDPTHAATLRRCPSKESDPSSKLPRLLSLQVRDNRQKRAGVEVRTLRGLTSIVQDVTTPLRNSRIQARTALSPKSEP